MDMKKLFPTVLFFLLLGGVMLLASQRQMARFANLAVPEGPFGAVYVQMDVGSTTKCLVSDRGGTTVKRSEARLARASWRCRVEGDSAAPTVVADSKEQPSFVFVPMTAVEDLGYPWIFEAVRRADGLPVPGMRWVNFHYNRQFQGLYLEIATPGRQFMMENGRAALAQQGLTEAGHEVPRPELLAVDGDRLVCFDRKMRPSCPTYNLAVADAVFPVPSSTPARTFLRRFLDPSVFTFIIYETNEAYGTDYGVLEPFPLPVALGRLLDGGEGWVDQRYRRWRLDETDVDAATESRYHDALLDQRDAVAAELEALGASIDASCVVMECDALTERARLEESVGIAWVRSALDSTH